MPNYAWVTRILKHTSSWNFKSCYEVIKITAGCVVFLHTTSLKRKPRSGAKSCAYRCVPRLANPLLHSNTLFVLHHAWLIHLLTFMKEPGISSQRFSAGGPWVKPGLPTDLLVGPLSTSNHSLLEIFASTYGPY